MSYLNSGEKDPIRKTDCHNLETFSKRLSRLHEDGFVNVSHHVPGILRSNEYIICTRKHCKKCENTTGLSILWRTRVGSGYLKSK